jgi:hypothetical protein
MRKLIINDIAADLSGVDVIALTKQINELGDLQNKRSSLSNTIELPTSATNNAIFSSANDVVSSSNLQRQFYNVVYIQDFEEIISNGKGKLIGCKAGKYEFVIYWGNISLVDIFGDKTINDLDLTDLNNEWNMDNVKALTVSGTDNKLIYPIMSTVIDEALPDALSPSVSGVPILANKMLPAVALSRILRQMEIDNGIVFSGADIRKYIDISSPVGSVFGVLSDLFIPASTLKQLTDLQLEATSDEDEFLQTLIMDSATLLPDTESIYPGRKMTAWQTATLHAFNDFTGYFEATQAGNYSIDVVLRFLREIHVVTNMYFTQSEEMYIVCDYYDAGSGTWLNPDIADVIANPENYDFGRNQFDGGSLSSGWYTFQVNEATLQCRKFFDVGDRVRFKIFYRYKEISGSPGGYVYKIANYIAKKTQLTIKPPLIAYGDTWQCSDFLPKIKQIDLLKYILVREGMLIQYGDDNIIQCRKLQDIINDVENSQDLSPYVVNYSIDDLHAPMAQKNIFKYSNAEILGETGQGEFTINDNTLPTENESFVAPFSASENELWSRGGDVVKFPVFKTDDENKDLEQIGARILRLFLKYMSEDGFCYFEDDDGAEGVGVKFVARFPEEMTFQSIINGNYGAYADMMNDYKRITVQVSLSVTTFNTLDLMKPVYIAQLGGLFLIEKIQDFVAGQKTNITLIKI